MSSGSSKTSFPVTLLPRLRCLGINGEISGPSFVVQARALGRWQTLLIPFEELLSASAIRTLARHGFLDKKISTAI